MTKSQTIFNYNCWYKPPNTTLEIFNAFEDLITRMDSENKEIILLGDYNCDWSRLGSNSANAQTNRLAGIVQTFQFQQLISDPTRITANSKTLIDRDVVTVGRFLKNPSRSQERQGVKSRTSQVGLDG